MKIITGSVIGQNLTLDQAVLNVSGTVNLYKIILDLDSDWDDADTIIVSFVSSCGKAIAVDYSRENGAVIPWEVLQTPEDQIAKVAVGVIGYKGTTLRITTTGVYDGNVLVVMPASLGLEAAMTPTPDVYQQLKQLVAAQSEAIGQLSELDTDDKTSLVDAINEVLEKIDTGGGTVKSVNEVLPDEDGNVELSPNDIGAASETQLSDEALAREQADTELRAAVDGKQEALSQSQLDAVNSGIDSDKVAQITTNATDIATNTGDIDAIEEKIPSQATAQNQLADKDFVNSSVATNTANYISDEGQPFESLAALEAYTGTLTNNDYAFVVGTDTEGNTTYTRYKYSAETGDWAEEYVLNNSSFTSAQWAAIQSGITSGLVEKLANLNIVQTTGTSETAVMSQKATTEMVYADPATRYAIFIGAGGVRTIGNGEIKIGWFANQSGTSAGRRGAIHLGAYSQATRPGEMNIGSGQTSYGYNNTKYRLLTGVHDPEAEHDAATKGYVDAEVANAGTAFTNAEFNEIFNTELTEES